VSTLPICAPHRRQSRRLVGCQPRRYGAVRGMTCHAIQFTQRDSPGSIAACASIPMQTMQGRKPIRANGFLVTTLATVRQFTRDVRFVVFTERADPDVPKCIGFP